MRILLTGGAGFIGSHVAELLAEKYPDYQIFVLDKMDYCASAANLAGVRCRLIKGDVQSIDLVSHVLEEFAITHVLHFAAQTHVDASFGNSIAFTMNNTLGTHVLLEAARKYGRIQKFVNVSTDEVYGDSPDKSNESCRLEPTNPYSAAKAGAEMLCKAYLTSYGLPVVITRGNNVFGPRQYPEKLIPKFILLGSLGRDLPVHGDGSATRSYLYVTDVADAFDRILHRGRIGETYNIGTEDERTVADVARHIAATFAARIVHVRDRAFNDKRYFIGSEKLRDELGWEQRVSFDDGMRATIDWYLGADLTRWAGVESALLPHPYNEI